jgi:tetratricopeptide (TPR) repeat protein
LARPATNDIAHEQVTDHWIRRRPSAQAIPKVKRGELSTVGGESASDRDFGLAYAQMAERGDQEASKRALELLRRTEELGGVSGDADLHTQLGFLEQVEGHTESAAEEYRLALRVDGYDQVAAGDLALIEAVQHRYGEAAALWSGVFDRDPAEAGAGTNLAALECGAGKRTAAAQTLERVLHFAPDNDRARRMLAEIQTGMQSCNEPKTPSENEGRGSQTGAH